MPFWSKPDTGDPSLPKHDRGTGSLDDYAYDLRPKKDATIRLADSDQHQDELTPLRGEDEESMATAVSARTMQQEGVDAPIEVRIFAGRRVTGVVGVVPRGLESIVDEAIRRLEDRGDKPRIPVRVVETKRGLRVDLLMGRTR